MALTIVAELIARPGKEDELREALKAIIPPTLVEPGCIRYDMHEDNFRPGHFIFYETWEDREIWDTTLRRTSRPSRPVATSCASFSRCTR